MKCIPNLNERGHLAVQHGLVLSAFFAVVAATGGACGSNGGSAGNDTGSPDGSASGSSGASSGPSTTSSSGSGSNDSGSGSGSSSGSSSGSASSSGSSSGLTGSDGGMNVYYASPTGMGTACTSAAPCSITQAQKTVQSAIQANQSDITVLLADGVYTLTAPLVFTAADSPAGGTGAPSADAGPPAADAGVNGHAIVWQAAPGAHPVLSGAMKVSGWTVSDMGKNIWKATVPSQFATRQLFVEGKLATRARSNSISRSDMNMQASGWSFTNTALAYLNNFQQPARAELNALGSWTNRYSQIQSVSNGVVTMAQPAWDENTWGYDEINIPPGCGAMCAPLFRASAPIYVENDYTLLDQPGEWYQDTKAGALYYIPLSGQNMSSVDVELPQLQYLLAVGGTCRSGAVAAGADCVPPPTGNVTQAVAYSAPPGADPYAQPAHDLAFVGLTFSYTSWLEPNTDGYADQQSGGYLVGPRSDYPGGGQQPVFEAWRPHWRQMPAAVQVSNAYNISFVSDRFVGLGEVGLGIGNDSNGHLSGVGLGANGIRVQGCVFSQIAGGGIVIGGVRAWAHHPCGDKVCAPTDPGSKLIDQNMIVTDNLIHDVGIDYRDFAGVMATYTANVVVSHNELYNLPYSGISTGLGWGTNDAGGNSDYKNRVTGNLYLYQPLYQSATVAMNNTIMGNYVHEAMLQMNDGGCHYNLGFQPGTVVTENYCEGRGSGLSGTFWGEYNDEGSAYITETKNVYADFGAYVTANANASNNTGHITFTNNWGSSATPGLGGPANVVQGNIAVGTGGTATMKGMTFPSAAQTIVNDSGLEPAYATLQP